MDVFHRICSTNTKLILFCKYQLFNTDHLGEIIHDLLPIPEGFFVFGKSMPAESVLEAGIPLP